MEGLAKLRQRLFLKSLREHLQQGIAHQRQIGQQARVARTRAVFAHQRVAPPVVAHFHSAPVASDQLQPLPGRIFLGQRARQVIARFGGSVAGLFDRPLAAQYDQTAGVGKVGAEGFDVEDVQAPGLHASVARLGVGKKGVSFNPSSPWACWSSLG